MLPGDRFKNWIEGLSSSWGDRLRTWMSSWVIKGINSLVDEIEPGTSLGVEDVLHTIRDNPAAPTWVKNLVNKVTAPGHPLPLLLVIPLAVLLFLPMLFSVAQPLANLLTYAEERVLRTSRVDPIQAILAWRRDPENFGGYIDDLRDLGWSEDRIEALKFVTKFMPSPQDLVTWQAREVFEPAMIEKYGLDDEFGGLDLTLFAKVGVDEEQARNYWRAHWEHASWMQIVEMLHRGLLTEQDVYDWFRLVEIPPYWRDLLIKTAYTWPTRVDVRRWWDMRTITEERLRELYSGMGYRDENLEDYIRWTKVYVDFPYWLSRWQKGWVTEDDVREWLRSVGIPEDRITVFIQDKIEPEAEARVEEGKALTKSEIYKGVKQGYITTEQAIELIMELGYNRAEAEYLIAINVAVLEGSPETFEEFKDLTTKYRRAAGKEAKEMPEELKAAAAEVVRVTGELEDLEESIKKEKAGLIDQEVIPEEATARLTELEVARNRAVTELERVKSEYNRLVAEWKYGG